MPFIKSLFNRTHHLCLKTYEKFHSQHWGGLKFKTYSLQLTTDVSCPPAVWRSRLATDDHRLSAIDRRKGFTLIELVVVLTILGILSVLVINRGVSDYQPPLAARKLAADIEYARILAMTSGTRCGVQFHPMPNYYIVFIGSPATPATDPINQGSYTVQYGSGVYSEVTLSNVNFNGTTTLYFDSRGRPLDESQHPLTLDGTVVLSGVATVTVTRETGFTYQT